MGPVQYAELIRRCVESCDHLDEPPHYASEIEITGNAFYWSDVLRFREDCILTVVDSTVFDNNGRMTLRSFSYDFRRGGELIFRIDNHNRPYPASDPSHLHLPNRDGRIYCFPDSVFTDFPYVIHCIKHYYLNRPQRWENGDFYESDE